MTKYLATNTIEPTFAILERQSKLNSFAGKLAGWLKAEDRNSGNERRTLKRLHADLVALGFTETRTWVDVNRCESPLLDAGNNSHAKRHRTWSAQSKPPYLPSKQGVTDHFLGQS